MTDTRPPFFAAANRWLYGALLVLTIAMLPPSVRQTLHGMGARWLYILFLSFSLTYLLTPVAIACAWTYGVLDYPTSRKAHQAPTPLLGGFPLIVAFTVSLAYNGLFTGQIVVLVGCALCIGLMGVIDDTYGLPAMLKLLVQLGLTVVLLGADIILRVFPSVTLLGVVGNGLLTVLWVVGITNALNFFDGMDGLATGLSGIIALFLGLVAFQTGQAFLGWFAVTVVGICLGFLPYNLRRRLHRKQPAAIFLGDAGSTFLGFILAALAVLGEWSDRGPIVSLSAPILIFFVLIFDMCYITVERFCTGKVSGFRAWIEYVGRDHLHHRLEALFHSRTRTVLFIYLLSIGMSLTAVVLRYVSTGEALFLLAQAVIIVLLVTILERVGHREGKDAGQASAQDVSRQHFSESM